MKLNRLNNLHFILAGAIATIIALFVYMWLDIRSLERSATSAARSVPQTSTQKSDTAVAVSDAIKKNSQIQWDAIKHEELAKASADFFGRQADPPKTGSPTADSTNTRQASATTESAWQASAATDDWMFQRGQDVTGAEQTDSGAMSIPE